jgi:hypothetical protein
VKLQCSPSSRLISSLLMQSLGIRPHFFNQKMAQKEPEKNTPSTAASAIIRVESNLSKTEFTWVNSILDADF